MLITRPCVARSVAKSRANADALGLKQVEFREGPAEALPVEDSWADVVISNGAINLCADKQTVFAEIHRVGSGVRRRGSMVRLAVHPRPAWRLGWQLTVSLSSAAFGQERRHGVHAPGWPWLTVREPGRRDADARNSRIL